MLPSFFKIVILGCAGGVVLQSQATREERAPVPYLNRDGSVPAGNQNQRVFLDPATGDAVILFDFTNDLHQVERKRIGLELSRHIDPSLTVAVSFDPFTELWSYSYTLINGPTARQSVNSWWFKGLTKEICSAVVPDDWDYLFPRLLNNPDWPRLIVAAKRSDGVPPGGKLEGVVVTSRLAPSVGEVYNVGASRIPVFPAEPDEVTGNQIAQVFDFPYNFRKAETLLPGLKLPSGRDKTSGEYEGQLRRCQSDSECTGEFVASATVFLSASFRDGAERRSAFSRVQAAAKRPMEKELADVFTILFLKD